MALSPKTRYPTQVDGSDPEYPEGKAQNVTAPGDGNGTPWEEDLVNDIFGFQQALLDAASITASGTPDKVGASQYLEALAAVFAERKNIRIRNWFLRTPEGSYTGTFRGVARSPTMFVAVGDSGEIQYSETGVGWWSATPDAAFAGHIRAITYEPILDLFVIVGASGCIQTSPDGVNWTARTADGGYTGTFNSVTWNGTILIAVGSAGEIQTSDTGVTWNHRTNDGGFAWGFNCVTASGSLIVAVGDLGEIQTSTDGITWTHSTPDAAFAGAFWTCCFSDQAYFAAGDNQEIQTSEDGITWTQRDPGTGMVGLNADFHASDWANGDHIVAGEYADIRVSHNVEDWDRVWAQRSGPTLYGLTHGDHYYVAVGSNGTILTSLAT